MRRPAKSNVIGNIYKIHYVSAEHPRLEGDMGSCEFDDLEMFIKQGQPLQNEKRTVLHEHLEALNEHMKIRLEHDQIEQLEIGLMQLIEANPALVAYLRRTHASEETAERESRALPESGSTTPTRKSHKP